MSCKVKHVHTGFRQTKRESLYDYLDFFVSFIDCFQTMLVKEKFLVILVCCPVYLPWWLSWLDCGALINVDASGCGTSAVRGPTGHR